MSELHPLETEEASQEMGTSRASIPEDQMLIPQRIEVPGARITYTHQASSGRTFGFETLVEQMADREVIDGILDTWVGAATRQQAKIELLKAEHDLRLPEKRLKLTAQDQVRKPAEWKEQHERSGKRAEWKPTTAQEAALSNMKMEVQEGQELVDTIKRSIADYTALMNGHNTASGAANAH